MRGKKINREEETQGCLPVLPNDGRLQISTTDGDAGDSPTSLLGTAPGPRVLGVDSAAGGGNAVLHTDSPTGDRGGGWQLHSIETPEDAVEFGAWLQRQGQNPEQPFVGVAIERRVAFSTTQEGWESSSGILRSDTWDILRSTLRKILLSKDCPALVSRRMDRDIQALTPLFSLEEEQELAKKFVIDMTAASETSGVAIKSRGSTWDPALDALDAAVVGPQLMVDIPHFYKVVALPLARFHALRQVPSFPENETPWRLVYQNLFLRVLAHYSRDPVLVRLFRDTPDQDPSVALGELLDLEPAQMRAFLVWLVLGEDFSFMNAVFPSLIADLPDGPERIKYERVDKKLPVVRLWVAETIDTLRRTREAQTLYGRIRQSPSVAELLHHTLMGSVRDILDVADVSLLNYGSSNHSRNDLYGYRYLGFAGSIDGWTTNEPGLFEQDITQIARLGDPLIVPLGGKVVVG